jgi:MFS transporter, PHS family, inorganic phosphate transporter
MVGYVYYPQTGALPSAADTAIKISTSAGTVLGQLGFGFLADHLGRKKVRRFYNSTDLRCMVSNL